MINKGETGALRNLPRFVEPIAPTFCFLFGVLLLAFVMAPADGVWQLYAGLMSSGNRIYSDLGLNQQPLFFLVSWLSLEVAPDTIFGQRLVFLPILGLYVYFINYIVRLSTPRLIDRTVLQLAVFFTAIHAEFFRFDDYHAVAHVGVLASIASSLLFLRNHQALARYAAFQGMLATLVFMTRVNEGLAIVASVGLMVIVRHGFSKDLFRATGIAALAAAPIFIMILILIGESPARWLQSTFIEASSAKGGASLLSYPYVMVMDSIDYLSRPALAPLPLLLMPILAGAIGTWLLRGTIVRSNSVVAGTCAYLVLVIQKGYPIGAFSTLTPFVVIGLVASTAVWTATTILYALARRSTNELRWPLFLYPLFLFVFGSLSTGGKVQPLHFPLAMALLLFPAVVLERLRPFLFQGARIGFILLCTLLAVGGIWTRYQKPYSWLTLHVNPLGKDYIYRDDPRLGTHFITRELAALVDPVCARVGPDDTLLSTPFSFANYYCGVQTWRGYVQTWFDLSTEAKIDRLLNDLKRQPPNYVFIQLQEGVLSHHEEVFNKGRPLPYRNLQSYIREKVIRKEWVVVSESRLFPESHWLLVRTAPDPRSTPTP